MVGTTRPLVLLIEERGAWKETLAHNLEREGYETRISHDRHEGVRQAQSIRPDVILLDLSSRNDALEVCRQLREAESTRDIPVLRLTHPLTNSFPATANERQGIVSSHGSAGERSSNGDSGVSASGFAGTPDDHIIKPVTIKALIQRLKVLHRRRSNAQQFTEVIEHLGVRIDLHRYQAGFRGVELRLTPTEFRLLERLLREPGRAFTRTELTDAAIGEGSLVLERTIDVHIKALRKKLGAAGYLIETVWGVGYRFREGKSS
jgi:two-component system phosphate regulon response regulator PhoB